MAASNFKDQTQTKGTNAMNKLTIALAVGLVIALIDIAPMIWRKAPWLQLATPFTHWIIVAVLVAYSSLPLPMWAKGLVIGVLTTLPFLFVLAQSHPSSVPIVAGLSVVLGVLTGAALQRLLPAQA
jgi:hypothetical protein